MLQSGFRKRISDEYPVRGVRIHISVECADCGNGVRDGDELQGVQRRRHTSAILTGGAATASGDDHDSSSSSKDNRFGTEWRADNLTLSKTTSFSLNIASIPKFAESRGHGGRNVDMVKIKILERKYGCNEN